MIESPLLDELRVEWKADDVARFLRARFGPLPDELESSVRSIQDEERLNALIEIAARCADLEAFRSQLPS